MNEIATVDKFDNIMRIEYQGQLVLTTAQLADFYECTVENIRDNFRKNYDRFVESKHVFMLRGLELKNFKHELGKNYPVGTVVETFDYHPGGTVTESFRYPFATLKSSSVFYLWTKRGAARHAKMLNTDRAWDVFERLEDAYFNQVARRVKGECSVADFKRAEALRKLAAHAEDPTMKKRLVVEAANLLKGEELFTPSQEQMSIFK